MKSIKVDSVRQMILKRFKMRYLAGFHEYINGGAIELYIANNGHKGGTANRELRLMAEAGLLEKELRPMENSKHESVWYRYVPDHRELLAFNYKHNDTA